VCVGLVVCGSTLQGQEIRCVNKTRFEKKSVRQCGKTKRKQEGGHKGGGRWSPKCCGPCGGGGITTCKKKQGTQWGIFF